LSREFSVATKTCSHDSFNLIVLILSASGRFLSRNENFQTVVAQREHGAKDDRECLARLSAFMEHARSKLCDKEPPKNSLDGQVQSIAGEIKHMQKVQYDTFLQIKGHAGAETKSSGFKQVEIRKREAQDKRQQEMSETLKRVGKLATTAKFWQHKSEKKTRYQRDVLKRSEDPGSNEHADNASNVEGEAQEQDSAFVKLKEDLHVKLKEELQQAKLEAQEAKLEAEEAKLAARAAMEKLQQAKEELQQAKLEAQKALTQNVEEMNRFLYVSWL
jgi:hypothetical protein